ncbi:non-ribosomal peptide synthetase [Pseudomonas donghuensis]|uniref:non-ribosomal peptide synthetase n=2 Tax=Pseudomonas donghuensis TaxID=1163398 RepID=UPI00215E6F87|nr:non-ribosomal peptide synthetase [Pseudomonas donghuensis]UVL27796.1 amino acid adenylation domain-containing protein [Pseudomonas donghuensis]
MAGMDNTQLVQRFIKLPAQQRRLFLEKLAGKGMSLAQLPIPVSRLEHGDLPLSYAQQRQWFLWQLDRHSSAYHIPAALHLHGALDSQALQRSLTALVARHESLRTTFEQQAEHAVQRVQAHAELALELHSVEAPAQAPARQALIDAFVDSTLQQPFDLQHGPLLRARLLRLDEQEHVLVLALHHIVADGWSMQVLVQELVALYLGFSQGQPASLPALPIQYADYALWQRCWMEAGERERQLAYWTAHLGDEQALLELPHDRPRPAQSSYRGGRWQIDLPPELLSGLRRTCQREGVTLFMLLLASFQLLLHRYSGQQQIRVGVPVANRNRAETKGLIGFFVNTQVLKAEVHGRETLSAFMQQVKHTALAAQAYQDLPYEQLVEALQPERSLSFNPLFQVMFNHQVDAGQGASAAGLAGSLRIEALNWDSHASPFDLNLDTFEEGERLWASLTYALDLFDAATIERMAGHWQVLLQAFAGDTRQRLEAIALDAEPACAQGLAEQAPGELLLPMLRAQLQRQPDAVALIVAGQSYSHGELEARSNRLAWQLREAGIGAQSLVGLALERSLEMVVAQLAVLKAGAAYVPLAPDYPRERLQYMIDDSGMQLLLSHAALSARLGPLSAPRTLLLDEQALGVPASDPGAPALVLHPHSLAYVIYTSGSTGQPKGVAIRHGGLANHMQWMMRAYPLQADDRVLQKTACSFDASVWEFWLPLLCGAPLVLAPAELNEDLTQLWPLVAEQRISVLQLAPSLLQGLLSSLQPGQLASLRLLFVGGEALKASLVKQLAQHWQGRVINLYGPTESTIDASSHELTWQEPEDIIRIGAPISNVSAQVLDANLLRCPQGGLGELYLGGASLASGYHRRPGLTAERFIPDPYGAPGARLYRSGDLVRRRAQAELHYVGRIDHQLKLRGLRIELGEIEACLQAQAGVREAVVLAQEGPRGPQLVGYVVAEGEVQVHALREALAARLPAHMVPSHLLRLAQLPLTVNGKLDRKALPLPENEAGSTTFSAPQGDLEQAIAQIWAQVLKREQIGRQDNFFELGGDSIVSIQVVSRARQAGIHFSPKDLFQYQTVQSLATVASFTSHALQVEQGPASGELALLPIQRQFFDSPVAERHHWNQSVLLAPRQVLEPQRLEQALQVLVAHHDALRQRFVHGPQGWRADHCAAVGEGLVWQRRAASAEQLLSLCEQAQRSLDLGAGPLLRALLVDLDEGGQRLLLVVHHLVVDGVSWRILFEDLQAVYAQLAAGQAAQLPPRTSAVQAWAGRLQQYAGSADSAGAAAYWTGLSASAGEDLPCDNRNASLSKDQACSVRSRLDAPHTRALLQQAPAAYRTQINDLLLTALAQVICQWSGQASTWVQLEGHGREALFEDIDLTRTVGWFTTAFPACLTPGNSLGASIKAIKEQLRAIPNKGLDFGVLHAYGSAEQRQALARLPTPRITFNYLGQFDASFDDPHALFAPASEASGAEQGDQAPLGNWLSINGQVYGGELTLDWTFSQAMFAPATVQRLADALSQQLVQLVEHCLAPGNGAVTPSDFPLAALSQAQLDRLPLAPGQMADIYPLSPMQQGMLFHALNAQTCGDNINQLRVQVQGLDVERFRHAWQATLDAHDSLRSQFHWQGDFAAPVQVVVRDVPLAFASIDLRGAPHGATALDDLAAQERNAGFALDSAPLLRLSLIRRDEQTHEMIFTSHHILMDGWSNAQLLAEVLQRYAGETVDAPIGRYRDYIGWLQGRDGVACQAFWRQQLQHFDGPTLLSQAIAREPAQAAVGSAQHQQALSIGQTQRLHAFARAQKVTLNTLVQGAWSLLLQHYSGQDNVTFGATVSGRPAELKGIERQIGLFINSLPVIGGARAQQSLQHWLQALQTHNLNLREQEHTPLYEIQRWAGHSGQPLFDTLLVFENYPVAQALEQGAPAGLRFGEVIGHEQNGFPLTLLVDAGEQLSVTFKYTCADFDASAVQRLGAQLHQLLLQLGDCQGHEAVASLSLFSAEARAQQVAQGAGELADYPLQCSIQQLIEAQVQRTPQAPALVYGGQSLSYAQLNARANRLAWALIGQGVGPDVLVGIAAERSLEMVIGLLAILKAGGAYVPLDPDYPRERLAHMFADSGIELLLTQSWLLDGLPPTPGLRTLLLDQAHTVASREDDPQVAVQGEHLAYVIYTSGSTGKPKGAGNRHSALVNRLCWMQQAYGLDASDAVLQKTPFSFDVSVWEFFWPLMTGARLVVAAPGDHRDPDRLIELIEREGISTLHFVPSMLQVFLQAPQVARCTGLSRIICSGEALPVEAQQQVFAKLPAAALFNLYGPTEAAIDVTHWQCVDDGRTSVPIGHAIANLRTYILDGNLEPVAEGVLGELYLAGAGLARGYHRRPGLTAERFPLDPFVPGQRMYRTGDLARFGADGAIEYAGRIDHQVKIRGLRIELGEIEARLLEHPAIREAVVVAREAVGGTQLVAYLVAEGQASAGAIAGLREFLRQVLPEHMLPSHLVALNEMPLSPNGKLDRRQLPAPPSLSAQALHRAPQSALQQQVAATWQAVLGTEQVGLDDNFFQLGGHSLMATQVVMRLRDQLALEVPLKLLFEAEHLEAFCAQVQALQDALSPLQDELTKSLEALKRLSAEDLEKLLS